MKKRYFLFAIFLTLAVALFGAMSPAPAAKADADEELRYGDVQLIAKIANQEIYYTSRDTLIKETAGGCPTYCAVTGLSNACGAVAGAEIVAFYDKYFPDMIANWVSYYEATGMYRVAKAQYVNPVMYELNDLMEINVGGDGVTEAGFKSGLKQYASNRGYSLTYTSAATNKKINYGTCVNAIDNNKVIVLFTRAGDVYDVAVSDGHDTVIPYTITGNHVMVAYGYVELKYYTNSTLTHTETFLTVATGFNDPSIMYFKINATNLEAAYVINVA